MDSTSLSPILPGPVIPANNRSAASGDARSAASADFDSFLTLLTAQLRNQDPMSPLDSTEFIAQLASFSTVEQTVGTNERLDALIEQSFSADIASFAGWIGRDVVLDDGSFRPDGSEVRFGVPTEAGADRAEATVTAGDGRTLARFNITADNDGFAVWDGNNSAGQPVTAGEATLTLTYYEGGAVLKEVPAQISRTVSGLRGTENGLFLDLADGGLVSPDKVTRLSVSAAEDPET